jgi:DNA transformation protein and related proteins
VILPATPDNTFKEFVLDQLSALPDVRARAMFGGHGLYAGDTFFGILFEGRLYFKVDEASRFLYEKRGMPAFTYEKARQTMSMRYYEVPSDVLESRQELIEWATRAIHSQGR